MEINFSNYVLENSPRIYMKYQIFFILVFDIIYILSNTIKQSLEFIAIFSGKMDIDYYLKSPGLSSLISLDFCLIYLFFPDNRSKSYVSEDLRGGKY